jgi:hypothetical protein
VFQRARAVLAGTIFLVTPIACTRMAEEIELRQGAGSDDGTDPTGGGFAGAGGTLGFPGAGGTTAPPATGAAASGGGSFGMAGTSGPEPDGGTPPDTGSPPVLDPLGTPCANAETCASGFCKDGVCCDTDCGFDLTDCQACTVAGGASADGVCTMLPVGQSCGATPNICEDVGECAGTAVCPGPAPKASCSSSTVRACAQACEEIPIAGGTAAEGGVTVTFQAGVSGGEISVQPCAASIAPPVGYQITEGGAAPNCWQLETTGTYPSAEWTAAHPDQTPPPIIVCFHYPQSIATTEEEELLFQLSHDGGDGFAMITTTLDTATNTICGATSSLSPFAIVKRIDTTLPVLAGAPGTIVAYATSPAGANVSYPLPTATDAVDGARPVACTIASGAVFPLGKTVVTCSASDNSGNVASASFTVWVQVQAPADGSFFLSPIRANGSSIFHIGRPVPVRFKLTGASAAITNLAATLSVTKVSNDVQGTVEDTSGETQEDTDFTFKYRPLLKWYAYRWKTRGVTQGTYQLRVDLGDGVPHQVNVSLKK